MKRANHLLEAIADPDNLRLAFWKARKGKNGKDDVENFRHLLDKNLLQIRKELLSGNVDVGNYHYFTIYEPKQRKVCAAAFRERVIHHALMNICHPYFDKYHIHDSYASRINKGVFAAVERALKFNKKYSFFLKLDVRGFFDNVDHQILKNLLFNRFKEQKLQNIFTTIIDSYEVSNGKGLPIGNLTSQYFANHYLAVADHYIKETLKADAYVRYMDDMVIWDNDKTNLLITGKNFQTFVNTKLQLTLKPFCLNKTEKGLPFLGFVLFKKNIRLTNASKLRFRIKFNNYSFKLQQGKWTQEKYQRHIIPLLAFTKHANSNEFRNKIINRVFIEENEPRESWRQLEQQRAELPCG